MSRAKKLQLVRESSSRPVGLGDFPARYRTSHNLLKLCLIALLPSFNQLPTFVANVHRVGHDLPLVVGFLFSRGQSGGDQSSEVEQAVAGYH